MSVAEKKEKTDNLLFDIGNLMGFFECELDKITPENANWGTVGTLNEVKKQMIETLSFLSGFKVEEIKNSLEEMKEV